VGSPLRITKADGTTVVLTEVAQAGDSITGIGADGAVTSLPTSEVQTLEVRRTHPGALLMSAMVAAGVAVLIFLQGDDLAEPVSP
jgi:hypothetical protein